MMQEYEVEHTISQTVRAKSKEDAIEKSEQFVRPLIDKDAANDQLEWLGVLSATGLPITE